MMTMRLATTLCCRQREATECERVISRWEHRYRSTFESLDLKAYRWPIDRLVEELSEAARWPQGYSRLPSFDALVEYQPYPDDRGSATAIRAKLGLPTMVGGLGRRMEQGPPQGTRTYEHPVPETGSPNGPNL